jgi:50S ribosomal protein L16 3-hydroxylase
VESGRGRSIALRARESRADFGSIIRATMPRTMLAGLDPRSFLRRHWQKRLLLARRALPEYGNLITRDALFALAAREDVQSRLVTRHAARWHVAHGPFTRRALSRLPAHGWTLLVQGLNEVLPRAQQLLLEFDFIPYARLDDVMVSYAPPGGGVGPHFDSYDVFLLQVAGTRRWRVSAQRDLALVEGAPLKLLRRFRADAQWQLTPGDMLYLPPQIAHDGIAVDECLTASIGFRAPGAREIAQRFLEFLQDEIALDGAYRDPELEPARHPAQIGEPMIGKVSAMLARIAWDAGDIIAFLGRYLTEPKPHVVFERPARPLSIAAFARRAQRDGIALELKTQLLYRGRTLFINGERHRVGAEAGRALARLANRRCLAPGTALDGEAQGFLYRWYRAGYIVLANKRRRPR